MVVGSAGSVLSCCGFLLFAGLVWIVGLVVVWVVWVVVSLLAFLVGLLFVLG